MVKKLEILELNDTQIKALVPSKAFSGTVSLVVRENRLEGTRFEYLISDVQLNTFAGTSVKGTADGPVGNAAFFFPRGLSFDASGNLFFTDLSISTVRKISSSGIVSTLASSSGGFTNGVGVAAQFNQPTDLVLTPNRDLIIADSNNNVLRLLVQD